MDYSVDWLNHRLKGSVHIAPLALNWKYVGRADLATRYGLDEGHHGMTDYGSECTIDLNWVLADNLRWKTRLYGYTTYKRAELEWENTITFQFNRYISTNVLSILDSTMGPNARMVKATGNLRSSPLWVSPIHFSKCHKS